jgi:putative membrane protein
MTDSSPPAGGGKPFDASRITRPDPTLLTYYFLVSLFTGPAFPFVFLPLFFKYETLKYRFDDSGISMSWGILFKREIHLTYRRIQDIHLTRNIVQRWMGLATVGIQTASGSATPEMSIEGVLAYEALRDYLYTRMRGARGLAEPEAEAAADGAGDAAPGEAGDEALELLREIRDLLGKKHGAGEAGS